MLAITSRLVVIGLVVVAIVILPEWALAADAENCLSCHRYRGLGRLDSERKTIRVYYVDPDYYDRALGPHARLQCSDCHERSEVAVIPHHTVSPVDCARVCHLARSDKPEVAFGHGRLVGMLEESVHDSSVLDTCNFLLGQPLRPGQSRCLLCHDEPTFRRTGQSWAQQEAPISRCNVCHEQQLPVNTRYYYWHVHARSRPARSREDIVRVCALCHSNAKVRKAFNLPDTTASYLASFHGKAMLLASERTAGCLECHVGPMQNVHLTQSHLQAGSPTSPQQLSNTCRSANCHPTAGHRVSSAAVHLELPTSGGMEYFIASLFVVLIVFTFGPSVILTALEMLQAALGRHDPGHHRRRELAEQLLSDPQGRLQLQRFTPNQRVQHWVLVACFVVLVVTGFPIKFADRLWAAWLIEQMGGLRLARLVHRWVGLLLLVGSFYHLGYVAVHTWRQRQRSGKGWLTTILDLPMVMRWSDWKQLTHLLAYLLFLRRTRPEGGRFTFEQKFEYFGVFWGIGLLGITGLLMWANAWTTRHLTGRVLTVVYVIHTFEAFLALLHVGVIHIIGVVFAPSVFPFSPAMFTGRTPPNELAEAHSAMLAQVEEQLQGGPLVGGQR